MIGGYVSDGTPTDLIGSNEDENEQTEEKPSPIVFGRETEFGIEQFPFEVNPRNSDFRRSSTDRRHSGLYVERW